MKYEIRTMREATVVILNLIQDPINYLILGSAGDDNYSGVSRFVFDNNKGNN